MQKKHLVFGLVAASIAVSGFAVPSFAAREKPTPEKRAEWMIKRLDTNGDGKVSLDEAKAGTDVAFKSFDANGDGQVTHDEIKAKRHEFRQARKEWRDAKDKTGTEQTEAMAKLKEMRPAMLPGMRPKMFKRVDTDKNGSLSLPEVSEQAARMFKRHDTNGDGFIDASDFTKKI